MTQQLLEEVEALREALREAHPMAKTQDDFDALGRRMHAIEAISASASRHSEAERAALERVQSVVADAIRANRDRLSQPTDFSGKVFVMMQAVRRGSSGNDG